MGYTTREDREDGLELRGIRFDGEPVLGRFYFAARDPHWRTARMIVQHRERTRTRDGFTLRIDAEPADAAFPLAASLIATAAGNVLTVETLGIALADFPYNRIGPCLLFDDRTFRHAEATTERGGVRNSFTFPGEIVARARSHPDAPAFHSPFTRLRAKPPTGGRLDVEITGDELELEDQRNWTDASYKAYTTTTGPVPLLARAQQRFEHRVQLRWTPGRQHTTGRPHPIGRQRVQIGEPVGRMPPVGVYDGCLSPASLRPAGGFIELNEHPPAQRPPAVELGVNGAVHAADDDSVLETAAMHGDLVRHARALAGGAPVHLGPVSFLDVAGDWLDDAHRYVPEPPGGPAPRRWTTPLAATWVVASAASAAPEAPASLRYFSRDIPPDSPAATAISRLAALAGRPLHRASAPAPLGVLAVDAEDGLRVAIANPSPDAQRVVMPDGREVTVPGFGTEWVTIPGRT
ncbi:hypothetical protein [Agromyces bauzanensis]|uniref:Uncharacterized protein n=1 Tax=Agromyces bauzanensis TaxID=1308924 RepID=A0A917UT64_9MICO|nr:hypothetical protein [Agromyces bauzanensis]GGJ83236.1 hypothetical protein GCM10011372_21930 [Agromyces bauzanensis]